MKGVVCAGGEGTRLGELTRVSNKHLIPVGPWPMIYYPLQMLQQAGVTEVMIVTGQRHAGDFVDLLSDGHLAGRGSDELLFSLDLTYRVQSTAGGIAQAVGLARSFVFPGEKFVVALGDNIIESNIMKSVADFAGLPLGSAKILLKEVDDPERFGVARFDEEGRIVEVVEKPGIENLGPPPSRMAVTGIYMFDTTVFDVIDGLEPSRRGELEISDVHNHYIRVGTLHHEVLDGWWRDAGTADVLASIGELIQETGANNL